MTVRVLFFAALRELAGRESVDLPLATGADVAAARQRLTEQFPALAQLLPRCMMAINDEYVPDSHPLSSGDELACIPPVSGGVANGEA